MRERFRNLARVVGIAVLAFTVTSCSTLGVRLDPRPGMALRKQNRQAVAALTTPSQAADEIRAAQQRGLSNDERLAHLLAAAKASLPGVAKDDAESLKIYNVAVGQITAAMQKDDFRTQSISVWGKTWKLETLAKGRDTLDPSLAKAIIPAAGVRIKGLHTRVSQTGPGVPYVFVYTKSSPFLADQPGAPPVGMCVPATAILRFDGNVARLSFQDTLEADHVKLGGKKMQLAGDFSAPIAVLTSRSVNRSIDVRAFLFSRQRLGTAGLFQYQPFDPEKIPVIFIHGLLSRPEAWVQALNGLMADPKVRDHYQFWFFLYPTGLPVWNSTLLLRREIDRFHKELESKGPVPSLHHTILVGHSMGGLIASLMIRQGGDKLWSQVSKSRFETLTITPESRKAIQEALFFEPRKDIDRVIFVSTPHRGSALALNPVAGFFARLVQLPAAIGRGDRAILGSVVREEFANLVNTPANSIRFLQANSPLLRTIEALPLSRKIPYHSIIGDRGRGDTPNSSDGVVAYWSSHLDSAESEKIVPSNHGANENPEGIEEIRRILHEAAN